MRARDAAAGGGASPRPSRPVVITLANQKGGVGKSAVACQLAYHLAEREGRSTLVVDLDHQGNTSRALVTGGLARRAPFLASAALLEDGAAGRLEHDPLTILEADARALRALERRASEHNAFASRLARFVERAPFDAIVIDTNPAPDIRLVAALVAATHVLAPLQLTQEALDGIGALLNDRSSGIRRLQETLRPDLVLIGILPNAVEPTPFQRANLAALAEAHADLLIPLDEGFAAIRRSTAIAEAQSAGLPVWRLPKTSARDLAREQLRPVFSQIAALAGLSREPLEAGGRGGRL